MRSLFFVMKTKIQISGQQRNNEQISIYITVLFCRTVLYNVVVRNFTRLE